MSAYYVDESVTLHHGDCLDVLRTLPDASVDSVVTDPPYDLTNRTPDVLGCADCGRTLGGRDGKPDACPRCGGALTRQRSVQGKGFMGKEWDSTGIAFRPEVWVECLRVLKPGGFMLAFGGTRTSHRLACAIEDAGFEIRDSIAWIHAQGFPKSLDVSKAIDKAAGAEREVTGIANRSANRAVTQGASNGGVQGGYNLKGVSDLTAPATPDARTWQGWGTALKPAFEPIIVGRKPLVSPAVNVLEMVESELRNRLQIKEIRWTSGPVNGAAKPVQRQSSSSTHQPQVGGTSVDPVDDSATQSGEPLTVRDSAMSTPLGAQPTGNISASICDARQPNSAQKSSAPMADLAPAATSEPPTSSPSTTSTAEELHTERPRGARSTSRSSGRGSRPDTESFAGIATGLTGSQATAHIRRLPDGSFIWPDGLPRKVAGGSLTVAGNVLAYGTGALNIDGCRVGLSAGESPEDVYNGPTGPIGGNGAYGGTTSRVMAVGDPAGRWPANVILDDSQAAELDRQSGTIGASFRPGDRDSRRCTFDFGDGSDRTAQGYTDAGGASRFFPTFHYEAKAPTSERPRAGDVAHPTVKPLDLMRWLVRLVTPPGGTVLDPFAGSGTTGEACVIEGFKCIVIEREATYLPLIVARLSKPIAPVLDFGESA